MKTDKILDRLTKRLENLLSGSSPATSNKWDNGPPSNNNWDIINRAIREHPNDSWFVPREEVYNAWTCLVGLTLGNIELRDFELERKFADMRHARVEEYDRKWEEARDRGDTDYTSKHASPAFADTFHENWTEEELEYYLDEDRFPIWKQGYKPMFDLQHPNWSKKDNVEAR